MAAEIQRRLFFTNLLDALWNVDDANNGTYAAGGNIALAPNQSGSFLESLHVEGAGELRLPLSSNDHLKLLGVCEQAPYGHGLATVVDTSVRRAWQVDASKVSFPLAPEFLSKSVQQIANKSVRALGLDGQLLGLKAHLYKLLLYETDGHFSLHRDTEKEPGMIATLVLQLPTQGGFEGGVLVVKHGGATKTFNFSTDSSTAYFYTTFFADCQHELQKVTSGTRLCLAFNLVRGNNCFDMNLGQMKGFSVRLGRAEVALRPWLDAIAANDTHGETRNFLPKKLLIRLQHKYTKKNLSFAGLKGDDRIVAQVLKNCRDSARKPWLDLHLCILTKHQIGIPADDSDEEFFGRRRHSYYNDDDKNMGNSILSMEDVIEESIETSNWVGTSNKPCSFHIAIDETSEVVINEEEEKGPFDDDAGPDETEYEGYTGNAGPNLEYWYHKAMIVIWPRKMSLLIAIESGASGALDILESKSAENDADVITMLQDFLTYCENHATKISPGFESDLVSSRLLNLCLQKGGREDVVRCLKLFLKEFLFNRARWSVPVAIGIRGASTATIIARAVQLHGWNNLMSHVMELLKKENLPSHGEYYLHLALELQKLRCHDGASTVARKTLELLCNACPSWSEFQAGILENLMKMLLVLEEVREEFGTIFLERLRFVSVDILSSMVVQSFAMLSGELIQEASSTQANGSSATLFTRVGEIIITKAFRCSPGLQLHIIDLVRTFYLFGSEQFFNRFIQAFVAQSALLQQQVLLEQLLQWDGIWKELSGTLMGRNGLQLLAGQRIKFLTSKQEPVFSWCMPFAKFPRHPTVEAFLRGPLESITYTGVNDLKHARNFSKLYFRGNYQDGYSAIGKAGGRGAGAYCVITKNRVAFEHLYAHFSKDQNEVILLRDRLRKLQEAVASEGGIRSEVVILSPDARDERDKRRRIEITETITITLDDDE